MAAWGESEGSQRTRLVPPAFLGTSWSVVGLSTTTSRIAGFPTETRLTRNSVRMSVDFPRCRWSARRTSSSFFADAT
jgi:hypothetical protein